VRFVLAVVVGALVFAGGASAGDGGSGSYTVSGNAYYFALANSGSTIWQYFILVGPPGARFLGGANSAEATAHCVVGQPDGMPNELECGPLSPNLAPPNVAFGFVATLAAPVACGAPFELFVSSTAGASFTRAADLTFAGSCSAVSPAALAPPVVHGKPVVGRVLVAAAPAWNATPARVTYQWQLCGAKACSAIKGATRPALRLTQHEAGHAVRIVATGAFPSADVISVSKKIAVARR
jgi:hypothetical protein